jgi:hypothetical protein
MLVATDDEDDLPLMEGTSLAGSNDYRTDSVLDVAAATSVGR